ncbi:Fic family protein [Bacillus carboniphilus]|uniref:Fic family protein n=1 Tax=Bacillus carboniphilus TaxID=86663 RepID=A0ABY9JTA4_9BACI|nr:Fic family protein [Bacillus carboniphilus]WLR42567.1 Fic family protein [Bacillus carboniphilus]
MDFKGLTQLKDEIEKKRPIAPSKMKLISQKFQEEWTYHSNALEGNTLSLGETAFFLREGLTIKGKTLREHQEVTNHAEAIDYLNEVIKDRDITEGLIKDLHAIIFLGIKDDKGKLIKGGGYKKEDNFAITLTGDIKKYTPSVEVPTEMEKVITWYEKNKTVLHPAELASIFHHKLVSIHPFQDGNGRVSRLCMNLILMKYGYPPAIIRKEERQEYLLALESADQGELSPLVELITKEMKKSLLMMKVIVQ